MPSQVFVLIHGAYQGGWIWKPVATRLQAAGHTVYAPSLDGCGERRHQARPGITVATQGEEIAELMVYQDLTDVILVGTSSGGMVISNAAERVRERISRLVFVDALALMAGERVGDIVNRSTPRETTGIVTGPTQADAESRLFADLEPETRAWALARYTLHPIAAMEEPMQIGKFWEQSWTAAVVYCHHATNPPESHQRRTAEKLNATWHELQAGHYPMLSHPEELTQILLS
jgi:pimeloyl-ACP methyl ester carboxylesterase